MDMQVNASTTPLVSGTAGGMNAGTTGKSASSGESSAFASLLLGQSPAGMDDGGDAAAAPDAQTASLLGLLQMLQSMLQLMPNIANASVSEPQGVQALPSLLLKAMNAQPNFAEQLLQAPGMQAWLERASSFLQAMGQHAVVLPSLPQLQLQQSDKGMLQLQDVLLKLSTAASEQPDNSIVQHLLRDLQKTVEPLLAQIADDAAESARGPSTAANPTSDIATFADALNEGRISVKKPVKAASELGPISQQIVVEVSGPSQQNEIKSKLDALAARVLFVTAALHDQHGETDASASADTDQQASGGDSAATAMPLQDLLKTLQQQDAKPSIPSTVHAQTFLRDMSDVMLNSMKLSPGEVMKEARLSLNPEHLGHIDLKITLQPNGQLVAQLNVDTAAARQMLESQLSQLRQTLQSQGLQIERLEVQQSEMASGMFQQRQDQSGGQSFSQNRRGRNGEPEAVDVELAGDMRTLADFRLRDAESSDSTSFDVTA